MTTLYRKEGTGFVPAAESEVSDSLPEGVHIIKVSPGQQSRVFNVDPEYALYAATSFALRDELVKVLMRHLDARPSETPITEQQQAAWENLKNSFGSQLCMLQYDSAVGVIDGFLKELEARAIEHLEHPAVVEQYEKMKTLHHLTKVK